MTYEQKFLQALEVGRPDTIKKLFPNSKALIVSGKYIDDACLKMGGISIAANARHPFVIPATLLAAQKAGSVAMIEIAKSEGGPSAYCPISAWNLTKEVDFWMNLLKITVPVCTHADHWAIKGAADVEAARVQIPTLFEWGMTSIAIDASHLPDEENLLKSIELAQYVPAWASLETEVGEIKGKQGLSTPDEALFLIQGLNAYGIFPTWIALNNGTTHGLMDAKDAEVGIRVNLTAAIHDVLAPYNVNGAQHGTSGSKTKVMVDMRGQTRTTKANVATALQMLGYGCKVNDYGNAERDPESGAFIREPNEGVTDDLWAEMVKYAAEKGWEGGDYKKLNLPFGNKMVAQPLAIRDRITSRLEEFIYGLMTKELNSVGTAAVAIDAILEAGSADLGTKATQIEDRAKWSTTQIYERAGELSHDADDGSVTDADD